MIAIISDTHLPMGRRRLGPDCVRYLDAAELIIHAGDISTPGVLAELMSHGPVAAVRGNVDDIELRAQLPERLELNVSGLTLGVVHDAGPARGRLTRLAAAFPRADAVIFGHSHIPLLETDGDRGFQIFNPGSPTDRRRQPDFTMGLAELGEGRIDFRLIVLDGPSPRPRRRAEPSASP